MKRMTVVAVVVFSSIVVSGTLFTVDGYSSLSNLISERGAQQKRAEAAGKLHKADRLQRYV